MSDRAYILMRTIEPQLAIAENNGMHEIWMTTGFVHEIVDVLKEQEHKDRMFHALEADWKKLKDQESVEPRVSTAEQRCGNCNKVIEMDGWKACPWCGKMIDWKRWWNKNGTHDNT